jgi:predicted butyrate kinase (DUF1464 family)
MWSIGLDWQEGTWRVARWDEGQAADLRAFTRSDRLWEFLEEAGAASPTTPVVLPSGFGFPLTRAGQLLDRDIAEITLTSPTGPSGELAPFLAEARRRLPRAFCIPAVKLLPSIPAHRKRNRIDLGGADVVCAGAWTLHCRGQAGGGADKASWLLLDVGAGGRAFLAVQAGRAVDGIGRTAAGLGEPTGAACLAALAARGVAPRRGRTPRPDPAEFWEAAAKETHALLRYYDLPWLVCTGGRSEEARAALEASVPLAAPPLPGAGYESALGAAVLAAGLTGGPTAWIIDSLGLRETRERALDWIGS